MMASLRGGVVLACFAGALVAPAVSRAGPREDVNAAIDKFLAVRSFHADMATTGANPASSQLDFVAPGRYRMRAAGSDEQIVIGDTMFMQVAGRLAPMPMPEGTLSQWRDPARLADGAADMTVTALGDEPVDGRPARKFLIDQAIPKPATLTLWIGNDGYPLQVVARGDARGQGVTTTIHYSRFNDPAIRIDAPK